MRQNFVSLVASLLFVLTDSVKLINKFAEYIVKIPQNYKTRIVKKKLQDTLYTNKDFKNLPYGFWKDKNLENVSLNVFKLVPITSVDVERSFSTISTFKNILPDRRQNFKMDNLEKHLIAKIAVDLQKNHNICGCIEPT